MPAHDPATLTGKWYLNPGDIPAPFVFPLTLEAGGTTDYRNARRETATWSIEGDQMTIEWGEPGPGKQSLVFDLDDDREFISGVIRQQLDLQDEAAEEAEAALHGEKYSFPNYQTDACVLMRDPGELEVIEDVPIAADDNQVAPIAAACLDDVADKLGDWLLNDPTFHDEQLAMML